MATVLKQNTLCLKWAFLAVGKHYQTTYCFPYLPISNIVNCVIIIIILGFKNGMLLVHLQEVSKVPAVQKAADSMKREWNQLTQKLKGTKVQTHNV